MEEKIKKVAAMMIDAVKNETPQDGVSILASALMNVVKNVGAAIGYQPKELEKIILKQITAQVNNN